MLIPSIAAEVNKTFLRRMGTWRKAPSPTV
jgi:hypothetical protein